MVLVVMLVYSPFSRPKRVLAAYSCENFGDLTVRCCDNITDSKGETHRYCTQCTNSDPPSNCGPRYIDERHSPTSPPTNILPPSLPPPPKNALPPSTTQTCPDGSTPDAKGNCPTTTNQQVAPSQNLVSNSPQPEHHHHKGQDSTSKKDNSGGS